MADTELTQCPECGGKCRKVIIHVPAAKVVEDWASQNNGRGKRIPQMEKNVHDRKYYKSRSALTEECRKKGYTWE